MKFVLRAIAGTAVCLASAGLANAQALPAYGAAPGAMSRAPINQAMPRNVQPAWNTGTATPTNLFTAPPAGWVGNGVSPVAHNRSFGQPATQTFTPTPTETVQTLNPSAVPATTTHVDHMSPAQNMAAIPVAETSGQVGFGGGCASGPVSAVTAQPIYGQPSFMSNVNGPYCSGGPVIPVQPAVQCGGGCPKWFGGVYGLVMDRDGEDSFFLLQNRNDPRLTFLDTSDADMDVSGGVEARIGRTFCNCRWGLELVYWSLFPNDQFADFTVPSPVGDPLAVPPVAANPYDMTMDLSSVSFNLEDPVTGPFRDSYSNLFENGAAAIRNVRVQRTFDYQNVELNLLSGPLTAAGGGCCGGGCGGGCGGYGASGPAYSCGDGCGDYFGGNCYGACATACGPRPRLNVGWLFGVRFLKIDETFSLFVDGEDGIYNSGDQNFEFRQDIETENNLVGVQLGMNLDYCLTRCLHIEAGSKFGFYGNRMNSSQHIYNDFGDAYVTAAGVDTDFNFDASEDDIAYLGELRLGLGYKLSCNFRLTGGYRVVAASGVALPLDQIAYGQQFAAPTAFSNINSNGSLVLHGGYAGLEFAW